MKILIACGGSAGHIFPGLALAEELKRQDPSTQVLVVVSRHPRDQEYLKAMGGLSNKLRVEAIDAIALPYRFSLKLVNFSLKFLHALCQSLITILKYAPEVVVGFGGYVSFAPIIVARTLGIPTLIHEQNLVPGRANRLLARFVDRIAVSFAETEKSFPRRSSRRIIQTGMPLRRHILNSKINRARHSPTTDKKFTILVVGGSQGAHKINELTLNCFSRLNEQERGQIHFVHLAGKQDFSYVQTRYKTWGVSAEVYGFLVDMAGAYSTADLLIARSGASTIFEAASFGLPCILIPHAYGTQHQKENALYLKRREAAVVLDEQTQQAEDLEKLLRQMLNNQTLRKSLAERIKMFNNSKAASRLREEIYALARGN